MHALANLLKDRRLHRHPPPAQPATAVRRAQRPRTARPSAAAPMPRPLGCAEPLARPVTAAPCAEAHRQRPWRVRAEALSAAAEGSGTTGSEGGPQQPQQPSVAVRGHAAMVCPGRGVLRTRTKSRRSPALRRSAANPADGAAPTAVEHTVCPCWNCPRGPPIVAAVAPPPLIKSGASVAERRVLPWLPCCLSWVGCCPHPPTLRPSSRAVCCSWQGCQPGSGAHASLQGWERRGGSGRCRRAWGLPPAMDSGPGWRALAAALGYGSCFSA